MYQAYNVESNTKPTSRNDKHMCIDDVARVLAQTCIDDVAMLQLREIAMAYRPELVASPVKDLGCHVVYSQILTRFPHATLNMHESNL